MADIKPIRFGLIGCSSIARRRFAPAVTKSSFASLERIGSRDVTKAEQFARELGAPKWGTYEDVMTDPNVDAVYISTPPALHESWVRLAAEHGKHILCEKAAFSDYRTAVAMAELCRRLKVHLMEGYVFGYHPQHAMHSRVPSAREERMPAASLEEAVRQCCIHYRNCLPPSDNPSRIFATI